MNRENKDTALQHELPPGRRSGLRQTSVKKKAAGIPAVLSSLEQLLKYMSPADAWKTVFSMNQKDGFLCPGCAWPDPDDERSVFGELCEEGIKAIAEEAQDNIIGEKFFMRHNISELESWSDFELGKQGRLAEPLVLQEGSSNYEPISWEEAFRLIASELNSLASPDEAVFYTSGRTSNEAAFLYQLFVRMYGTNNLPDCSNMCHESSGVALSETIGIGKGTVTLDDIHQAELLIIMGQNPGTNHPRMLTALEKCKMNGGKIIAVNPLPEPGLMYFINPQKPLKVLTGGTPLADLFLQVRINGDVPLLKAIMLVLLEEEQKNPGKVFDRPFIDACTSGFGDFIANLKSFSFSECVKESGVSEDLIREAAELIRQKEKIIVCWAMGLTQHANAVDNIKEIVNLLLLRGSIGKPGAGVCPVRGHSNVQGDRTMGIYEMPSQSYLDQLEKVFHFRPPRHPGYDTVKAIRAMHEGKTKLFFALGGNFLSATPDTHFTAEALRKNKLTVHVSTKLNRSHLVHGKRALILPCLGRTDQDFQNGKEQFVSCENSMGVVQQSMGVLKPPSEKLLSEVSIVCRLAEATLPQSGIDWKGLENNYDAIRDLIGKVIPGFERYNQRVRRPGGFYLPNAVKERSFMTTSGKAQFSALPMPSLKLNADEFIMMTVRSHDQFNTTIYGMNDRYRGITNERRIVMMNETDMLEQGLARHEVVDMKSFFNGEERIAANFIVVPMPIAKRCVATYFPEANVLVNINSVAHSSNTPVSKSVVVKLIKKNA